MLLAMATSLSSSTDVELVLLSTSPNDNQAFRQASVIGGNVQSCHGIL